MSNFCKKIVLVAYLFSLVLSGSAVASPDFSGSEETSLGLQMARRMILMNQDRPLPSRAYQQSVEMVRRKNAKGLSHGGRAHKEAQKSPSI